MFTFARVALDAARSVIRGFGADERAQDVFEYVLIIGVLTVAILFAIATPVGSDLVSGVVEGVCTALQNVSDTANGTDGGGLFSTGFCATL